MSKSNSVDKVKTVVGGAVDPRLSLVFGEKGQQQETAATGENQNKEETPEVKHEEMKEVNVSDMDLSSVAGAFDNPPEKPKKVLKGIYIDEDVLAVYEAQQEIKKRGWGSQLVSDLLRKVFENEGLLPKK